MSIQLERATDGTILSATFLRPSNFHAHLRRGPLMRAIAKHIMRYVKYLVVMPNTGPIRTVDEARNYFNELMEIAEEEAFNQLALIMTVYHTPALTIREIDRIAASTIVRAVKHYPPTAGTTTGSGFGIRLGDPQSDEQFRRMAEWRIPLLGHFEDVEDKYGRKLHPRDGEAHFVREKLWRFRERHPDLRICFEHASTVEAIEFVKADTSGNTFMTVTPQHSLCTEAIFNRSWANHAKCKPVLQSEGDRAAIEEFITSGDRRVGAGDDTAAHLLETKVGSFEAAANGAFWTWHGITAYANVFEKAGALDDRFEAFMSLNGPRWWGLTSPRADDTITLYRETERDLPDPVPVPEEGDVVLPFGWSEASDRLRIGWAIR